jgi:hypothetical protein
MKDQNGTCIVNPNYVKPQPVTPAVVKPAVVHRTCDASTAEVKLSDLVN